MFFVEQERVWMKAVDKWAGLNDWLKADLMPETIALQQSGLSVCSVTKPTGV